MIVKDPGTRVDFAFEWGAAYPEGQALIASEWLATPDEPGGVTIAAQAHELEQAAVTLAGGIAGQGGAADKGCAAGAAGAARRGGRCGRADRD